MQNSAFSEKFTRQTQEFFGQTVNWACMIFTFELKIQVIPNGVSNEESENTL